METVYPDIKPNYAYLFAWNAAMVARVAAANFVDNVIMRRSR